MTNDRNSAAGRTTGVTDRAVERDYFRLHLSTIPLHRALLRSVECRLLSRFHFERPMLDVGAGDGHFASLLFPDGIDVGIDPSHQSIREAAATGVYRSLQVASACELPFADASFRSVISNCVLEHIPDLDSALREISRVLRPGGLFATTVPSPNYERFLLGSTLLRNLGLKSLAGAYGRWMTRISYHYHYYPPEEWRMRLAKHGLVLQEWQYYFSPGAHRMFDLSHYLSAPSLLVRKVTGRWILFPDKPGAGMQRAILSRFYEQDAKGEGAYIMLACIKKDTKDTAKQAEESLG